MIKANKANVLFISKTFYLNLEQYQKVLLKHLETNQKIQLIKYLMDPLKEDRSPNLGNVYSYLSFINELNENELEAFADYSRLFDRIRNATTEEIYEIVDKNWHEQ